jgi:hypothetical protein
MKKKYIVLILVSSLLGIIVFSGCGTIPEEHKGAAVGAGIGATAGTIAGAVLGDSTGSTVLGGLVGALVGGVIGHYAYDQPRNRDETASTYNYQPSEGTLLTIEEAAVFPQRVRAGDTVDIKMTYAVLNPSPNAETKIREIREITHNGQLVGRPEVRQVRTDGTFTSTVPLHLPAGAKTGQYKVMVTVESENAKDTREITFSVV